jgi:hypothetical protein
MTDNEPAGDHRPPVVVARHADRGEAEVTCAHLRSAGVDAHVIDEVQGGTVPIDGEPGVAVAVSAADEVVARTVLADLPR